MCVVVAFSSVFGLNLIVYGIGIINLPKTKRIDDDNRVKLCGATPAQQTAATPVGDNGDYINASFVANSVDDSYAYIAAQGPTKDTVLDFVRMLRLYNVRVVICACNEFEGDKLKCHRYWPEAPCRCHLVHKHQTVSLRGEPTVMRGCVIRELVVRNTTSGPTTAQHDYEFTQFHLNEWPDHGVPDNVDSVISVLARIRQRMASLEHQHQHQKATNYMVVHCSAGCGRTGTLIAIDQVWSLIERQRLTSRFSLFEIARTLRLQRIAMIQTFVSCIDTIWY